MMRERGSISLAAVIATLLGLSFTFLFQNLTNYVAAKGALQQAARKAARCLSPSDPLCVAREAKREIEGNYIWYGYPASGGQKDYWIRKADYTGEMYSKDYQLEFNTYKIKLSEPGIDVQGYRIPVKRYVGYLNSWMRLRPWAIARYKKGDQERSCRKRIDFGSGLQTVAPSASWADGWFAWRVEWCREFDQVKDCGLDYSWELESCSLDLTKDEKGKLQIDGRLWDNVKGLPECSFSLKPTEAEKIENQSYRPGDKNVKPHLITDTPQFLVVEVASCDHQKLFQKISKIKSADDLLKYFSYQMGPSSERYFVENQYFPENEDRKIKNYFIFDGTSESDALISKHAWTFLKWQSYGPREREVCEWGEWEQMIAKWPELNFQNREDWALGENFKSSWMKSILVNEIPEDCPDAVPEVVSLDCSNKVVVEDLVEFEECAEYLQSAGQINQKRSADLAYIKKLNDNQRFRKFNRGELTLYPNLQYLELEASWNKRLSNEEWLPSWLPIYNGKLVEDLASLKVDEKSELVKTEYMRKDGSFLEPEKEDWLELILNSVEELSFESNAWNEFVRSFSDNVKFSSKELEAQKFLELSSYELDEECLATPIDSYLREVAYRKYGFEPLLSQSYQFDFVSEKQDYFTKFEQDLDELPYCAKYLSKDTSFSTLPVQIDISESLPLVCRDGTYKNCYSLPYRQAVKAGEDDISYDSDLVREVALAEFRRIFPKANLKECSNKDNSCLELSYSTNEGVVDLELNYQLPIGFPLNTFLGMDKIKIEYQTSEYLELALISP